DQLLDEQTGHNGLTGTGVVGEQEAERLTREHRLVHGGDLVRQRLDQRRVYGEHGVKQVCQPNSMCLRNQPEQGTVTIKTPRAPVFDDIKSRLIVTIKQLVCDAASRSFVGEFEG